MATIVDLKTWEKLDFTLEIAARLGEDVYCGFLSNFLKFCLQVVTVLISLCSKLGCRIIAEFLG
jgi:hypothetical protein